VRWDELPHLTSGAQWTVATVGERLAEGNAPWADYAKARNALAPAMKALGFKAG
jgi:bifunctional non-homologous end joining protein LigD